MFITRAELLPEDETPEQHELDKQAETAQMTKDRGAEGLFQGAFERNVAFLGFGRRLEPLRDAEDGVVRCPRCVWELEDGICSRCGYDGLSNDEHSGDDED